MFDLALFNLALFNLALYILHNLVHNISYIPQLFSGSKVCVAWHSFVRAQRCSCSMAFEGGDSSPFAMNDDYPVDEYGEFAPLRTKTAMLLLLRTATAILLLLRKPKNGQQRLRRLKLLRRRLTLMRRRLKLLPRHPYLHRRHRRATV